MVTISIVNLCVLPFNYTPSFLQTLMASLGATDIYDYSSLVLDLLSTAVHRGQDTTQCCDYHYQMLDKYCASRTVVHMETHSCNILQYELTYRANFHIHTPTSQHQMHAHNNNACMYIHSGALNNMFIYILTYRKN